MSPYSIRIAGLVADAPRADFHSVSGHSTVSYCQIISPGRIRLSVVVFVSKPTSDSTHPRYARPASLRNLFCPTRTCVKDLSPTVTTRILFAPSAMDPEPLT